MYMYSYVTVVTKKISVKVIITSHDSHACVDKNANQVVQIFFQHTATQTKHRIEGVLLL